MATTQIRALKALEGRRICLALRGGDRLDDCELVSVGRTRGRTLWVYSGGADTFVRMEDVVDIWEAA